jgi:adenylate cyclase
LIAAAPQHHNARVKDPFRVRLLARLWPSWPPLRLTRRAGVRTEDSTERLLREAEIAAERRAGLVRIAVAVLLLVAIVVATDNLPGDDGPIRLQIRAAQVTLTLFGLVGILGAWLASKRLATRSLPFATATADAVLILGNLAYCHWATGTAGHFFATFPVIFVVPIAIAASAIHYRPRLQAYVAALYVAGIAAVAVLGGNLDLVERREALGALYLQFGPPPNAIRVIMLLLTALILVVVARQGRALLERAVRETTLRLNLTRYLPRELAPILSEEGFASLRAGRRVKAVLLFVDIRDSSALAEGMDAARLAIFISAFRRRVMRAAAEHGGVVDKFLGDGALILFGVPADREGDAARALACGRTLLDLVAHWNVKRRFDPPVRVGIGCHCGEVFCGVVGDEARLEFTVLGEPVNITARIEQSTKSLDRPFLASHDVVEAADELDGWEEVQDAPLRGITRSVRLMAPRVDAMAAASAPAQPVS